jgi:nucleotide-binding universal stress UspA family protein
VGTVVVGVDGSAGSLEALRFALEEARLRRARLVALCAWMLPLTEVPGPFLLELPAAGPTLEQVRPELERAAERRLDEALESVAGHGDVEIERRVVEAAPAHALVEASEGAELLVVGSRGHGGFAGLRLGSVGQQCAHHARCPVVIVPTPRSDAAP